MLLKRLELQGYKTFAARTEFDFGSGITAIVGPNGSGKSNVADAIRWVLGEQRPTSLRIKRTEDLIFAGSSQRPRQGLAEVTMILDNSTGWLPIEYAEVALTRRVYRSGESEYRINGARVRSRDISDLLAKGGINRDAYVVIGQGLVDAALSLRPTERRSLFEAAAGISLYQSQKGEAQSQLEETHQNLTRLRDIMHEIEPRLSRLEKQAQRAEEHEILSCDLNAMLQMWYGYQWQRTWSRLQEAEVQAAELTEFAAHDQAGVQELRAAQEALVEQQAALRQKLSAWHEQVSRLHADAEEVRRRLAVSQERQRLLMGHRNEITDEIAALMPRQAEQLAALQASEEASKALQAEYMAAQAKLQEAQRAWKAQEQERAALATQSQALQRQEMSLTRRIAQHESRLADLEERRQEARAELVQLEEQASAAKAQLEGLEAAYRANLAQEAEQSHALEQVEAQKADLAEAITALDGELSALEKERAARQHEMDALRSRQRMLAKMRAELSGYYAGVRAVIQADHRGQLQGILGPLVRLLEIEPSLDTAISVALGAHLQDMVVETWHDAEAAIELLKRSRSGRATFLPLDTLRTREGLRVPAGPGILGLASQLVGFDPRYQKAVDLLLNRTLVVEDLLTARRLLRNMPGSLRLVTLAGELVLANGSLSGGASQEADSKIALERDWREIPVQVAALDHTLAQLDDKLERARAQRADLAERMATLDAQEAACRSDLSQTGRARADMERNQEAVQGALALHQRNQAQRQAALEALDRREDEARASLDADQGQIAEVAARHGDLAAQVAALDASDLRAQVARAESEVQAARRNRDSHASLVAQQQSALDRTQAELEAKRKRAAELGDSLAQLQESLAALAQEMAERETRLSALRQKIEPAEKELVALQRDEKRRLADLERAQEAQSASEGRLREATLECRLLSEELERLQQRITEEMGPVVFPNKVAHQLYFDFGDEQVAFDPSTDPPPNLEEDIRELRGRLRRLGVINPDAPAEYEQEMERYGFLSSQVQDLEQAIQSLHGVIQELDEIMEQQFSTTFKAIAREFSAYFQALFGGGSARLTLTNPEDMDQTGIDIVARPPGKRLQSLALLSGGERALTAAALLFAILKTNPLPFCVLDEVDAMLDEANVGRFRDSLVAMADQTQFIIITHNRQTIEAAQNVYGITMRRDGISAALSLRLDEAEAALAQEEAAA